MTVIVLTNCPVGLRGFLTRWLLEISPGVFLGAPSTRIRELLWAEVREYAQGRALLAYQTDNEQGYAFETHDHAWHPTDHDGLTPDPPPGRPPRPSHGHGTPRRPGPRGAPPGLEQGVEEAEVRGAGGSGRLGDSRRQASAAPAHAGMVPPSGRRRRCRCRGPHARGDVRLSGPLVM